MTIKINFKALAAAAAATTVAFMTATGTIDNYIAFAGELNAMAFFMVSGVMAVVATAGSFEIVNQ
jgi:hypothetical protein